MDDEKKVWVILSPDKLGCLGLFGGHERIEKSGQKLFSILVLHDH